MKVRAGAGRVRTARAVLDRAISETAFQRSVTDLADVKGWRWYHANQPLRDKAGWPDLFLARGNRCLALELKTERGVVSEDQWRWLFALREGGVETAVLKPSDWPAVERLLA